MFLFQHPWWMHVDVWQNQYNIVKFKKKKYNEAQPLFAIVSGDKFWIFAYLCVIGLCPEAVLKTLSPVSAVCLWYAWMNLFVFCFCLFTSCLGFPELFRYENLSFIEFEKFWDTVFFSIFFLIKRNRSLFLQMVCIFCGLVDACMFPRWLSGKESACQCSRCGFDPWVGKSPCRRKWLPTPVFLPGKSHRQRSLVGYSLWGYKTVEHDWACM